MANLFRKIRLITIFIVLIFIVTWVKGGSLFSKPTDTPTSVEVKQEDSSTEVKEGSSSEKSNVQSATNVLLLDDYSSMVIASLDNDTKDIAFTSVEDVNCLTDNKEELLQSIAKSTNINLDKFIKINMSDLMNVVSILGDIDVNITEEDMEVINNLIPKYYAECEDKNKGEIKFITAPGNQKINEYQAMAYMNLFAKDSNKQKEVMLSFVDKAKNMDFTKYIEVFNTLKPHVETNLTLSDMLQLVSSIK